MTDSVLTRADVSTVQVLTSVAFVVLGEVTVRPVTAPVEALVAASNLVVLSRYVPVRWLPDRPRVAVLVVGAGLAAAVLALATSGTGSVYGFFVAGHAGYQLRHDLAMAVAALCSLACGGVLLAHLGPGWTFTPWYVGAATGLAVALGTGNRARADALTAALRAARAAERAAAAEAREQVLAERARIARDVHDVLAHSLAGITMQQELAVTLLEAGRPAQAQEALGRAQSLARDGLGEAQRTVRALREDALPLVETVAAMARSTGADAPVVAGTPREVPTAAALTLVRVAQEALTNAARHAPGAPVRVTVTFTASTVGVEIVNGAAPAGRAAAPGSGMGLVGIRERVALAGGDVELGPVLEGPARGGWRVAATIPA